jgi:hypothetical protein
VSPADQSAAGRSASPIDADWNPKVLRVELLFEAHHTSRFEIS